MKLQKSEVRATFDCAARAAVAAGMRLAWPLVVAWCAGQPYRPEQYRSHQARLASLPRLTCEKDAVVDKARTVADEPVLLFIHVFKAAGSSVRELFRRYAERCGRRWACLVQCANGGQATDRGVLPCRLRDTVNLNRASVVQPNGAQTGARAMRRNPDAAGLGVGAHIIGGHYHYGMHAILPPERPYFYFTVVREPLATWISGLRYNNKELKTVEKLTTAMTSEMEKRGHYANAITYLIEASRTKRASAANKLHFALQHLENVAVVGAVESWQTTLDLLTHVLDGDEASPAMWNRYRNRKRANKAKTDVSPRDVVASLKRSGDWPRCAAYLETENAFYVAALRKHATACRVVLGDRCRLRWHGGLVGLLNASLLELPLLDAAALDGAQRLNAPT